MPFKDKERRREWDREWAKKNRHRFKEYNTRWKRMARFRRYGLTFEGYIQMLKGQRYRCAICRSKPEGGRRLAIDHCHRTGRVRGLLCDLCNTALGKLGDTVEGVTRALKYLKNR